MRLFDRLLLAAAVVVGVAIVVNVVLAFVAPVLFMLGIAI